MEIKISSPGPNSYDAGVAIFNCGAGLIFSLLKKLAPKIGKLIIFDDCSSLSSCLVFVPKIEVKLDESNNSSFPTVFEISRFLILFSNSLISSSLTP